MSTPREVLTHFEPKSFGSERASLRSAARRLRQMEAELVVSIEGIDRASRNDPGTWAKEILAELLATQKLLRAQWQKCLLLADLTAAEAGIVP